MGQSMLLTGAAGVLALLVLVVLTCTPRLALAGWLVALCFLPVWAGVALAVDWEPHVAASVGLVASLMPVVVRGGGLVAGRLTPGDALFATFVVASLVPVVSGRVTSADVFLVLVQWTAAFLTGRLIGYRVPLAWVYGALAVVSAW
jgi:hypothetical protein